jgi:hypothetical protein
VQPSRSLPVVRVKALTNVLLFGDQQLLGSATCLREAVTPRFLTNGLGLPFDAFTLFVAPHRAVTRANCDPQECRQVGTRGLNKARQQDQHGGNRDGAADPSCDLGERHKLHPIGSCENGNVACAALSTMARVDNGRLDWVHAK